MEKQTFTPGPWTYARWDEHGYTKFYVSQQEGAPYTPEYSDVADLISETVSGERVAIQEANAALIAAAPELYEALKEIIDTEWIGGKGGFVKARAALAKARGE